MTCDRSAPIARRMPNSRARSMTGAERPAQPSDCSRPSSCHVGHGAVVVDCHPDPVRARSSPWQGHFSDPRALPFSCPFEAPTRGSRRQTGATVASSFSPGLTGPDLRFGMTSTGPSSATGGKCSSFGLRTRRSRARAIAPSCTATTSVSLRPPVCPGARRGQCATRCSAPPGCGVGLDCAPGRSGAQSPTPCHSARSACVGSIRLALTAGMSVPMAAVTRISPIATLQMRASKTVRSYK